jgi:hypothetical protein
MLTLNEIIVWPLKTWDKPFPPFSFTIDSEEIDGVERLSIQFNLNPAVEDDKQTRVWIAILENFNNGTGFRKSDIEPLCESISPDYIKKLLAGRASLNRIERLGSNRDTRYRFAAPLTEVHELSKSEASNLIDAAEPDSVPGEKDDDMTQLNGNSGGSDQIIPEYLVETQCLEGMEANQDSIG